MRLIMRKILIVDDSPVIVHKLTAFFEEDLNYVVVASGADGNEAISLYEEHKPDLLTLDITMPNKDGIEALETIIKKFPEARILMITAIDETSKVTQALGLGALGYIKKPLELEDEEYRNALLDEIEDAFDGVSKGAWNYI